MKHPFIQGVHNAVRFQDQSVVDRYHLRPTYPPETFTRWLHGRAEEVSLKPPYALVTAGESLHWMEWDVILPRLARVLTPHGLLAIADIEEQPVPWHEGSRQIKQRFTNNPAYRPFDWIAEVEKERLFQKLGKGETAPMSVSQAVEDYIAAQHARSTLSLDTMTASQATQFDTEMQALLLPYASEGLLTFSVVGRIIWGKPTRGKR
jgi:hypothetical protein